MINTKLCETNIDTGSKTSFKVLCSLIETIQKIINTNLNKNKNINFSISVFSLLPIPFEDNKALNVFSN